MHDPNIDVVSSGRSIAASCGWEKRWLHLWDVSYFQKIVKIGKVKFVNICTILVRKYQNQHYFNKSFHPFHPPPKLIVFSRIFIYNLSRYRINSCLFRISLEESDSDVLEGEIMRTRKKRKQNIIEIDEMQTTQQEFTNWYVARSAQTWPHVSSSP